jgi:hypothetical protein
MKLFSLFSYEVLAVEFRTGTLDTPCISYVESSEVSIHAELHQCYVSYQFLGAFAQGRKAPTNPCPFVPPSVCPHTSSGLPMDGFS